ncbi:MAG: 50S ribosomal protein L35 [Planctomycetes bacterium]|nr:50S ribosomal protein L35 [Planctomycetota bacterium]
MPKLKTHKGTKKRFRLTGRGKVKRWRAGKRHLLSGKSGKRLRHLRRSAICHASDQKRLSELLAGS